MVVGTYRDFFTAAAASAGALTGLLFVALSVSPRQGLVSGPAVFRQVRAAASLLAFTNVLAVSLFSLVPGTNPGYPALTVGVIGIFFTAAGLRSILSSGSTLREQLRQHALLAFLLLIFGTESVSGILALAHPGASTPLQVIGYTLATSLIVGIARAWELVGDRGTGLFGSIAVLTGHEPSADGVPGATGSGGVPGPGVAGSGGAAGPDPQRAAEGGG